MAESKFIEMILEDIEEEKILDKKIILANNNESNKHK